MVYKIVVNFQQSNQKTKAPSQPQGHETPPQQGQGQQPESAQAEIRKKKSC